MVPKRFEHDGNEIKIDSLKKEGIQSWMVISRDVENIRKNTEQNNFHCVDFRHQFCRSDKWNDIFSAIDDHGWNFSNKMTRILQHNDGLRRRREVKGAMQVLSRKPGLKKSTEQVWFESPRERKQQAKICLDWNGHNLCVRVFARFCERNQVGLS